MGMEAKQSKKTNKQKHARPLALKMARDHMLMAHDHSLVHGQHEVMEASFMHQSD